MTLRLISVVVPTYNRAYCLARTLDSVLQQKHTELEVILVDDGSTDDTRALVKSRYAGERRVKYLYQNNQGVTAARNQGLRQTQGAYVAFLDSDDAWQPWKLQLQLACLDHFPEVGMVWTDMVAIGQDGAIYRRKYLRTMYEAYRWFTNAQLFSYTYPLIDIASGLRHIVGSATLCTGDLFSPMVMGNLVHTSTVLLRRERLDRVRGFNKEFRISGEDYDFHLRTCKEGPVGFIDLETIQYQTGMPDRLTGERYKLHAAMNCLRTILPVLQKDRARIRLAPSMVQSRLAEVHEWVGEVALQMGQTSLARRHLLASLGHRPLQARTLGLWVLSALPFGTGLAARKIWRSVRTKVRGVGGPGRGVNRSVEEFRLHRTAAS
jgi:glycosyltransferase involved in cell wall biosynthesis